MFRERLHSEEGVALITALLVMLVIQGASVGLVMLAVNESRQTGVSEDSEAALHAAEAATDRVIVAISQDEQHHTGQAFDATAITTPAAQRAWAVAAFTAAEAAAGSDPAVAAQFLSTAQFTALGIRPTSPGGVPHDFVFGVSRVEVGERIVDRMRVVRAGIGQGFYAPDYAVLSGGDVTLNGLSGGSCPAGPTASGVHGEQGHVHSNSTVVMNGQPGVSGNSTAVGNVGSSSNACGTETASQPAVDLPVIDARRLYDRRGEYMEFGALNAYDGEWYDLCPGGTVRVPSPDGSSTAPCALTNTILGTGIVSAYRGWRWRTTGGADRWEYTLDTAYNGVYYVYRSNAQIAETVPHHSVSAPWITTILVEADPNGSASASGNFSIAANKHPRLTSLIDDTIIVADRNFTMNGNSDAEFHDGLILAKGDITTAGSPRINGALIAGGRVTISGNTRIEYNGGILATLPGIVAITKWNEV